MPIYIYKIQSDDYVARLCEGEWRLIHQIEALKNWINEVGDTLEASDYVADLGFCWRKDAACGGPVLDAGFMNKLSSRGISLHLSEYPGFAGLDNENKLMSNMKKLGRVKTRPTR